MLTRLEENKLNNTFQNIGTNYKHLLEHANKVFKDGIEQKEVCSVSCQEVEQIINDLSEGLNFVQDMTRKFCNKS